MLILWWILAIIYAIGVPMSYMVYYVLDMKVFGKWDAKDAVVNAVLALMWPLIAVLFAGLAIGWYITGGPRAKAVPVQS